MRLAPLQVTLFKQTNKNSMCGSRHGSCMVAICILFFPVHLSCLCTLCPPFPSLQEAVTGGTGGTQDVETSSSSSSDDEGHRGATAGILGAAGGLGGAAAVGQHRRGRREIGEGGNVTNVHPDWPKERVHMIEDERGIGGPVHLAQEGARVRPVGGGVREGASDYGADEEYMAGQREGEQQPGLLAKAGAAAGAAVAMVKVRQGWFSIRPGVWGEGFEGVMPGGTGVLQKGQVKIFRAVGSV